MDTETNQVMESSQSSNVPNPKPTSLSSSTLSLRKGKWTMEEEQYANKIIHMFSKGILHIPPGTTLRSYLSEKLNCDPMRITKKFAGPSCIGKQIFQPLEDRIILSSSTNVRNMDMTPSEIKDNEIELEALERIFRSRQGGSLSSSSSYNHPKSSMFSSAFNHTVTSLSPENNISKTEAVMKKIKGIDEIIEEDSRIQSSSFNAYVLEQRKSSNLPDFIPFTSASKQPTSIPSNKSNQSISTHNSTNSKSSSAGNGTVTSNSRMRRAISAPELTFMEWQQRVGSNYSSQSSGIHDYNRTVEVETFTTKPTGFHEKRKHSSWSKQSSRHSRLASRKSQSMDNLSEFEDYYADDLAAGDLLLGFFHSVTECESSSSRKLSPFKLTVSQTSKLNPPSEYIQSTMEPPPKRQITSPDTHFPPHIPEQSGSSYATSRNTVDSVVSTPTQDRKESGISNTISNQSDRVRTTSITSGSTDGDSHSNSHMAQLTNLQSEAVQSKSQSQSPVTEGLCLDDL